MKIASRLVTLLFSFSLFAAQTAQDQERLVAHLERTRDKFLKEVTGLTPAQWNYKAAPDRWSIAEVSEHIAAAEPLIRGAVAKTLQTPTPEELVSDFGNKDDLITSKVIDRSRKAQAPEPLVPTNRYQTPQQSIEAFRAQRAETMQLAMSGADFRAHKAKHPVFGTLDAQGWMLFLSAHTERHTLQIEEVKADPNFPKN
jgi:hypothetical protein